MTGQGYDCNWGITGSYTGFGNITPQSQKHSYKSQFKQLKDGQGTTRGYKHYDFYQEASIEGYFYAASGNTGTITPLTGSVGSTCIVSNAGYSGFNGNWSVKDFDITGKVDDMLTCTINIFRYDGTPVV